MDPAISTFTQGCSQLEIFFHQPRFGFSSLQKRNFLHLERQIMVFESGCRWSFRCFPKILLILSVKVDDWFRKVPVVSGKTGAVWLEPCSYITTTLNTIKAGMSPL
ncbi:hypothetical protein Bbelb_067500 [Branchiostoma belcheri]|nr:hypothetical protein Bbelb_067500 [Branchiostoma belcheri]